ncbi:PepSY-associated TM helix domain-containing protein [Sphingomonas sp. UYP23]
MSKGFRQSQATLHTWSGLLVGWVLFIVFVTGTAAYWREALNRWAQPELPRIEQPARVVRGAQALLQREAPNAASWFITVPSTRSASGSVFWVPGAGAPPTRSETSALIDGTGAKVVARATRGGDFFYRFHFDLHYVPYYVSRWIVGICAMFMLVAILSGIVTHKKIFRDFFTFRGGKGQRSWLDGHNAVAVLGLPFHLMITYTGLVTLMTLLMPWAAIANYTDPGSFGRLLYPEAPPVARADRPAPLVDLVAVLRDGERRLGAPVDVISVTAPGDASARILLSQSNNGTLSSLTPRLTYDGVSGRPLWASPPPGAALVTAGAMIGLHAGRFADTAIRWVYFLCGIGGSVMVASGLVLWSVKRREKLPDPDHPPFGVRLVERLNIGFVAGFPAALVGFLWANRLLPLALPGRAEAEITAMFVLWGALLVHAFVRRPRRAWVEQLGLTAALLLALPLFDMLATNRGLPATIASGDTTLAGVDLTLLALGLAYAAIARAVHRHIPSPRRSRSRATV